MEDSRAIWFQSAQWFQEMSFEYGGDEDADDDGPLPIL